MEEVNQRPLEENEDVPYWRVGMMPDGCLARSTGGGAITIPSFVMFRITGVPVDCACTCDDDEEEEDEDDDCVCACACDCAG